MAGKFVRPAWCAAPSNPELRKQTLRFVAAEGRDVPLAAKALLVIGRADTGVDVQLRGTLASRQHAAICQDSDGRKYLVDLRSTHGTFLNGQRLQPHEPVRWTSDLKASFGSGDKAEVVELTPPAEGEAGPGHVPETSAPGRPAGGDDDLEVMPPLKKTKTTSSSDAFSDLYGDLPEATVTRTASRVQEKKFAEPIPPPKEPKRILFLDIDGVLRSVHGRTDFAQNVRTMVVDGKSVALMGDGNNDNLAGIDFWPQAMRALRYVVSKSNAGVVLSSDWRKDDKLIEGINNQMTEYRMPKLYDQTPDLDKKNVAGVVKAIHSNVREKRAKEIRRWLSKHPNVEHWVAIDDMDLSANRKDELLHQQSGSAEPMPFLETGENFIRTNPAVGLTTELAKMAASILAGVPVSPEEVQAAYAPPSNDAVPVDPSFQGLGPTLLLG